MKLLILFLWSSTLYAQTFDRFPVEEITVSDVGDARTIGWCIPPGQDTAEWIHTVEVLEFPPKEDSLPHAVNAFPGSEDQWSYIPQEAGMFYARAKSCNGNNCSPWSISHIQEGSGDPTCAVTVTRFVMYFKLATPTGGGIIQ